MHRGIMDLHLPRKNQMIVVVCCNQIVGEVWMVKVEVVRVWIALVADWDYHRHIHVGKVLVRMIIINQGLGVMNGEGGGWGNHRGNTVDKDPGLLPNNVAMVQGENGGKCLGRDIFNVRLNPNSSICKIRHILLLLLIINKIMVVAMEE